MIKNGKEKEVKKPVTIRLAPSLISVLKVEAGEKTDGNLSELISMRLEQTAGKTLPKPNELRIQAEFENNTNLEEILESLKKVSADKPVKITKISGELDQTKSGSILVIVESTLVRH